MKQNEKTNEKFHKQQQKSFEIEYLFGQFSKEEEEEEV